jgi:predicted TIM-barrel fold metal-dependent hydrolase
MLPTRIISADCHVDLAWLPEDLFTANAPARWAESVPRVVDTVKGRAWQVSGRHLGYVGGIGSVGREFIPGQSQRVDRIATTGLYADGKKGVFRPTTPELRLQDQDRDGICGEVLYGVSGLASKLGEPQLVTIVYEIYNGWLADFCRSCPQRFAGLACVPSHDARLAAKETRRAVKLGLRGVEFPASSATTPLWHPDWEPLWHAAEECELSISFHAGGTPSKPIQTDDVRTLKAAHASRLTQFQIVTAEFLSAVIFGGALERHANLKIVLGESGLGWIPYVLERMDLEFEDQFRDLDLSLKPSEYWRRQMYATFQQDHVGIALLDTLGADNVMWGSDYPHPDGVFPDSQEVLQQQLGRVPEAARSKIVCDNAAALYGLAS